MLVGRCEQEHGIKNVTLGILNRGLVVSRGDRDAPLLEEIAQLLATIPIRIRGSLVTTG